MSWKLRVLVSAMLLAPPVALPLGLGEIRLGSALNEPLSAEIDLVAATPEELGALQAQLASRDLFQRYGLDRPAYLDTLEFRVGRGQDGRSVLLVRSREAIGEPFVSFLVDVSWPRGRLLARIHGPAGPAGLRATGRSVRARRGRRAADRGRTAPAQPARTRPRRPASRLLLNQGRPRNGATRRLPGRARRYPLQDRRVAGRRRSCDDSSG